MCSWQRKQKKATSLVIKRHLRLIGKPRGPWTGPPTHPTTMRVEGGPPVGDRVCYTPGSSGYIVRGEGGDSGSPTCLPTPAAPATWFSEKSKRGRWWWLPGMQRSLQKTAPGDPAKGWRASKPHARSRSECTYKTIKAPAEHRDEGCRAPSWALLGGLGRCRPQNTLRRGPAA